MDEWEDTATTIDCALFAMGGSWFKQKWTVGIWVCLWSEKNNKRISTHYFETPIKSFDTSHEVSLIYVCWNLHMQRTCISRIFQDSHLYWELTSSLKFRLVIIYHKLRTCICIPRDYYLHLEPTVWSLNWRKTTTNDVYFRITTYTENQQFEV